MIGLNNWFLRNGEAPVIIDPTKIRKTEKNLNAYFKTQGYFQARVRSLRDTSGQKRGTVRYIIESEIQPFSILLKRKLTPLFWIRSTKKSKMGLT